MVWLAAAVLAAVCMIPFSIQIDVAHSGDTKGRVILRCWKLRKTWQWMKNTDASQQDRRKKLLRVLLHGDHRAWRYLLGHSRLLRMDVQAFLHTGDAARSALLSGALRSLLTCIPPLHRKEVHLQILPEFFREHSTVNLRCIIRLKLGTLLVTAGMLGLMFLQAQQLKESEAM